MKPLEREPSTMQPAENIDSKSRNLRRVSGLDEELRETIPGMFDRMPSEEVARQLAMPKPEIIEEVLRDTRAQLKAMRRGPQSETLRTINGKRFLVVNGGGM